jgi:ABC-type transport system involved in multi-copper enzyme maturation permease subunit
MRSLLWKEWHEQRWKLAFGSLILGAFALIGLRARVVADDLLLEWLCFLSVVLLPVMASTGLIASEREERTIESLLSLPVAAGRIFWIKALLGVLLTAGPLVVAGVISVIVAGGRELSTPAMALFFAKSITAALSLFFWMFALTVRLPTETRAALIAMAVVAMWLIISLGITQMSEKSVFHMTPLEPPAPSKLWLVCPFVFLIPPETVTIGFVIAAVFAQAVVGAILLLWASRQFISTSTLEGVS